MNVVQFIDVLCFICPRPVPSKVPQTSNFLKYNSIWQCYLPRYKMVVIVVHCLIKEKVLLFYAINKMVNTVFLSVHLFVSGFGHDFLSNGLSDSNQMSKKSCLKSLFHANEVANTASY